MSAPDIVIVGGGPAGFSAARTINVFYPESKVTLIEEKSSIQIPCSIPSVIAGELPPEKNLYPLKKLSDFGIKIEFSRVEVLDVRNGKVFLENGKHLPYDKLILATGWMPRTLGIEGENLEGIHYISTNTEHVKKLSEETKNARKILLVGGGFIGIDLASEIKRLWKDKEIILVEAAKSLASGLFSQSIDEKLEEELVNLGVKVLKEATVERFEGKEKVERVVLSTGYAIDVDMVFVAIGFRPRVRLAQEAGIRLTDSGKIAVDEFLRTSADGVYAAGNCRAHRSAIDGKEIPAMLAFISAMDGRISGMNVGGEPTVKDPGVVPSGITAAGDSYFGFAGYTEKILEGKGIEFVSAEVEATDGYPAAIENAHPLKVKLYFTTTGKIIGGEVLGKSKYISGLVDFISRLIYEGLSVEEVISVPSVAFPAVTPSPLIQPVQIAALMAKKNL
jgi:NADPH-dependent 2,4-dienoyl-CoA reductase/sulfur reductase-like enzyme